MIDVFELYLSLFLTFRIHGTTMKEFVGDVIKIAMANRQLFTRHHNVQITHDVMAHYQEAKDISFASSSDNSNIEVECD